MSKLDFMQTAPTSESGKKPVLTLGTVVLLSGILAAAVVIGMALMRNTRGPLESGRAPDFEVTTFAGQNLRLNGLRGQVVVLNFWASWCLPCRDEAPVLEAIWQQYGERGVVVLGIAWSDIESDSRTFVSEFALTYPNAPDLGTKIGDDYLITAVPETYIIDRDGNIVRRLIGSTQVSVENLSRLLDPLLAG